MRRWTRLPLRIRLTLLFAAGMAVVLGAVGGFVYVRTAEDLLAANDAGLRLLDNVRRWLVGQSQYGRGRALMQNRSESVYNSVDHCAIRGIGGRRRGSAACPARSAEARGNVDRAARCE